MVARHNDVVVLPEYNKCTDTDPFLCVFWRAMVARMILVEDRAPCSAPPRHISRTTMAPKTPPPIFDQPNSLCELHMGSYNLLHPYKGRMCT